MSREAWQRLLVGLSADELRELDALLHEHLTTLEALGELELPTGAVVEQHVQGRVCYRLEHVRCGKATCRCMQGGPAHGPYWSAYHYLPEPRTTRGAAPRAGTRNIWASSGLSRSTMLRWRVVRAVSSVRS